MGYFPNGTAGESYQARFCANCRNWRHDEETDTFGCPVWDLHIIWNYDAVLSDSEDAVSRARTIAKKSALDHFIPHVDIANAECKMFLPNNPDRCTETPDMFG